ncbi:GNAT family N-acetyltransferase [Methanobrevibacter sp.]|uniref:GNAT family N-acetyltransferase n=1 Tax=Methanobrevibacter sp. TaxID=66852 RepID=UPI00388E1B49
MDTILTNQNDGRFLKLVEELDQGYYERIGEELSRYEKYNEFTKPHTVLLALDLDEPIACASYRVCSENNVEFKRVYVKKEYRKKGIAYKLIKQLENTIDSSYKYSYIVTGKNNYPAIRLYEKLDYKETPKFGQFKDDETVICMKKEFW